MWRTRVRFHRNAEVGRTKKTCPCSQEGCRSGNRNMLEALTRTTFSKVLPCKWEAYCPTNRRRTTWEAYCRVCFLQDLEGRCSDPAGGGGGTAVQI